MRRAPHPRSRAAQRGVAMVELAITLPLLLFLMLAVAELGRALYQHNTLTKSVRDGARYLAAEARAGTGTGVDSAAFAEARNLVLCGKLACTDAEVILPGMTIGDVSAAVSAFDHVTISAAYAYQSMLGPVLSTFGLAADDIALDFTLRASTTMRML